ncbi:MAG: adenosylmethionine--8-amino-7-oxononanoate transaminase [Schwartzia sp. (in: firmicutes)]
MALEQENWENRDLQYIWHPAAQMKDYEELPPMVIARAKGAWLYDVHGKKYLDIISSWWCNLFGHCNPIINQAVKEQIDRLEHVIFANFSNEAAIRLAEALAKIVPKGLAKFHFNDNGSSAVEAALKMCFQYHVQTGHPERQKFMCLSEGYHGETIGALSVGSLDLYAQMYQPMMMENIHVEAPDCYRCPYGRDRDHCQCECFEHAEKAFDAHGKETAAIIVEPLLQGSAGMRIYPPLYLQKLRTLCDETGVLLIADEIATGFGRTGRMFACDHAGITPDFMTISKGLTGGYLPMSITVTTQAIYDAFYADYSEGKAFVHSHTYAGNPLASAAALAVQHIFRTQPIFENAAVNAKWLTKRMEDEILPHPNVGEVRHIGLIHAFELVADKKTKEALPARQRTGYEVYRHALRHGLLLRPIGDVLYFNPPLNITQAELDTAIHLAKTALNEVLPVQA